MMVIRFSKLRAAAVACMCLHDTYFSYMYMTDCYFLLPNAVARFSTTLID